MKRAVLISALILLGSLAVAGGVKAGLIPPFGGEYTNLNGSGTAATFHIRNGCDENSGFCFGNAVYRFQCDGRTTDCRSNESFSTGQSLGNPGCDKTVQLDVFDHNCRQNGGWDCGIPQDYMVWYSGACVVPTATPTPTPPVFVPTATPTPTPIIFVPTATPTPTRFITPPVPGPITQECPSGTVFGGINGSNLICVQQVQNQVQNAIANANASTGSITINTPSAGSPVVIRSTTFITPTPGEIILAAAPAKTVVVQTTELPKTGLPIAAWSLTGLAPLGYGLRRFGAFKKISADTATFIWQSREFNK